MEQRRELLSKLPWFPEVICALVCGYDGVEILLMVHGDGENSSVALLPLEGGLQTQALTIDIKCT